MTLQIKIFEGKNLIARDIKTSDPYVKIDVGAHSVKTSYKPSTLNPQWNENFDIGVPEPKLVMITVMDHDIVGADDFMGQIVIKKEDYAQGQQISKWFPLADRGKKGETVTGEIRLELQWSAAAK